MANYPSYPGSIPYQQPPQPKKKGGLIAGLVIGIVLVLALIIGGIVLLVKNTGSDSDSSSSQRDHRSTPTSSKPPTPTPSPTAGGTTVIKSEDGVLSFTATKDFTIYTHLTAGPYYNGEIHGDDASITVHTDIASSVTDATSLERYAANLEQQYGHQITSNILTQVSGNPAIILIGDPTKTLYFMAGMVDGQQRVITVTCLTFSFTDPQIAKTVCNPILESVKFTP